MPTIFQAPKPSEAATEKNRFSVVPMCQSLTAECARKFLKALHLHHDELEIDLESGRAYHEESVEEVQKRLDSYPASFKIER